VAGLYRPAPLLAELLRAHVKLLRARWKQVQRDRGCGAATGGCGPVRRVCNGCCGARPPAHATEGTRTVVPTPETNVGWPVPLVFEIVRAQAGKSQLPLHGAVLVSQAGRAAPRQTWSRPLSRGYVGATFRVLLASAPTLCCPSTDSGMDRAHAAGAAHFLDWHRGRHPVDADPASRSLRACDSAANPEGRGARANGSGLQTAAGCASWSHSWTAKADMRDPGCDRVWEGGQRACPTWRLGHCANGRRNPSADRSGSNQE
jgi:hypothetical protein